MQSSDVLTKYELILIVDANLTDSDKESIYKEASDVISKHGGKVINSQVWLDKQKFSFTIKKLSEGTYYQINFEADGNIVKSLESDFKLKEKILRFLVTKTEANV